MNKIIIVVPCYNEQDVLKETKQRLYSILEGLKQAAKCSGDSKILFVDDGSRDSTWEMIEEFAAGSSAIAGIKLSRNFGHQNALLAGLFTAEADAVISIDADLQDDTGAIEIMIDRYLSGYDVVYAVRRRRASDTVFKRGSARAFYRIMQALGAQTINDHADYRLLSNNAIKALKDFREVNLFLRGIVPLLGFRSSIVYFDRQKRHAGTSKYNFRKMFEFAIDAVTSFSIVPLRLISAIGVALFLLSTLVAIWATWVALGTDRAVPGWTSILLPILLLGGVQILCLGILGEYLGKLYVEVKARPRYIIEAIQGMPPSATARKTKTDQA